MDFQKFLRDKFESKVEFFEIDRMFDYVDISDGLKSFLDSADFSKYQKAYDAPKLALLKRLIKNDSVPAEWAGKFDKNEVLGLKAGFDIRGLSGNEYARIESDSLKELHEVAMNLLSAGNKDKVASIKALYDIGTTPRITIKRIMIFEAGVVWPEMDSDQSMRMAAKLNERCPIDFIRMTDRIVELTGEGKSPVG